MKVENPELIVINSVGMVIGAFFYGMYLYVQAKMGRFTILLPSAVILGIPTLAWYYLNTDYCGLLATMFSISSYIVSLDSLSVTLKTRDASSVNLAITFASVLNGFVWMCYALLVRDIFVLMPNVTALISAAI